MLKSYYVWEKCEKNKFLLYSFTRFYIYLYNNIFTYFQVLTIIKENNSNMFKLINIQNVYNKFDILLFFNIIPSRSFKYIWE